MKCNIGRTDRMLRMIIGIFIAILGVIYNSWFGLIGVVVFITALIRFCPAYLPFNIDTSKNDDNTKGCGSGGCGCSH